jgi:hypothetical protein
MNERKLIELLAYAMFRHAQTDHDNLYPADSITSQTRWREDDEARCLYRSMAEGVLASVRHTGVTIKIAKEKVADDALLEIITIPPRAAYELPGEAETPEETSGLANDGEIG